MRIRRSRSSMATGLMQLCLVLLSISLLVNSAVLPFKHTRSLASDAPSIAAALASDHVSFEPHPSASASTASSSPKHITKPSSRDATVITTDPYNTDPYKYELCCAPEGTWKCNIALTYSCRSDHRLRCELDGTLNHRKEHDECSKLCNCFEWSEKEGKPPTIAVRATKSEQDKKDKKEAEAKAREKTKARKAWEKALEGASPFDFVDFPPRKVVRDEGPRSTSPRLSLKSGGTASDLPSVSKRTPDKDPSLAVNSDLKSKSRRAPLNLQNRDHHSSEAQLEKRHNYALVCELQGMRDVHITRSCAAGPRYYSCDRLGGLFKRHYDSYCDQHCACQYLNPNPMFKHGGSLGRL